MKIRVTQQQFELLLKNIHWIKGLSIEMSGKTANRIIPDKKD